jgi:DNA-binding winged helix-turn-helix (wHTH) protein/tetratricopeptide (TPR) repeat protein
MKPRKFRIGSWVADEAVDALVSPTGTLKLERRAMATLLHLAERAGEVVTRDELLDTVWGNVTVTDHSVATVISDLRRALGDDRAQPAFIETIAKRGYRLIAPVERLGPSVPAAISGRLSTRRAAPALAALAVLLIAGLVAAFWMYGGERGRAASSASIVVRDFSNDTGRADLDHISYALSDIVSSTVAQASDGPVIRWPAQSDGRVERPPAVGSLVAGRLIAEGDQTLALVQVSDAATRELIWSESYVIAPPRLASRSREVARDVAGALGLSAPEMLQANVGPDAYERYWRARYLWDRREGESIRTARRMLEELTREQPRFAAAHAALADIYAHKSGEELGIPRTDTFAAAQIHLDRALSLAPGASDGFVTQAVLSFYRDRDIAAARRAAQKAIDDRPGNVRAWQTLAMAESAAGAGRASLQAIERARTMDPASGSIAWDRAWHLYMAGRYPEALTAIGEAKRFGQSGSLMTALILGATGRDDAAFAAWIERAREAGVAPGALAAASRLPDRPARYRALAEAFRRKAPDRPVIAALLLVKAGDSAAAARELERAEAGRSDWMAVWAPRMREFAALRRRQG